MCWGMSVLVMAIQMHHSSKQNLKKTKHPFEEISMEVILGTNILSIIWRCIFSNFRIKYAILTSFYLYWQDLWKGDAISPNTRAIWVGFVTGTSSCWDPAMHLLLVLSKGHLYELGTECLSYATHEQLLICIIKLPELFRIM